MGSVGNNIFTSAREVAIMRSLRKYLQRVGLVSTLLISGVLGGLLAPLPSDAAGVVKPPELTLQVDGLPTTTATGATLPGTSILGASVPCNAADVGLGYTACYAININPATVYSGTNNRMYRIQNATGATARLRVGDNAGQDNFTLIGVQFIPVNSSSQSVTTVTNWGTPAANTTEQHILTIRMKNKFNSAANVNNATTAVAFGMRSGGEFRSAPLSTPVPTTSLFCGTATTGTVGTVRCSTVGDSVVFTGKGIFSGTTSDDILSPGAPTASNSQPLSLTVGTGSATASIVSYDGLTNPTVGQVNPTYPRFNCKDDAWPTTCQPEITLTMTATLKGPDTFVLVNGGDGYCAICTFVDNSKLTRFITLLTKARDFLILIEPSYPSAGLRAIIDQINVFLANFNTTTDPTCPEGAKYIETISRLAALTDQMAFTADGAVPADIAPQTITDLGIRLTWGAVPTDLDSHLYIPNGLEVFYSTMGSLVSSPYAKLDVDITTGNGPEVVTVAQWMKGTYQYFVHDYSNRSNLSILDPMTGSPARVELIRNGVVTPLYVPPAGEGTNRYWHVFDINVDAQCVVTIVPVSPVNAWSVAAPVRPNTIPEELCLLPSQLQ